ncbi:MAG TPA: hypothetical protein VGM41_17820 [Chitinophagaceae bacterium]|jgi:hypothetical protein
MNKAIKSFALGLLILGAGLATKAQDEEAVPSPIQHSTPRWVSSKGYWVVESNPSNPKHACVYFYTNVNVLVYKETIDGVPLALNKTRTKMQLKKVLESLISSWEAGEPLDKTTPVMTGIFKKEKNAR